MWILLESVATEIEADIIIGLLEEANIPIKKNYPGIGNLRPSIGLLNGVEILVPQEFYSQAKNILITYTTSSLEPEDNEVE